MDSLDLIDSKGSIVINQIASKPNQGHDFFRLFASVFEFILDLDKMWIVITPILLISSF